MNMKKSNVKVLGLLALVAIALVLGCCASVQNAQGADNSQNAGDSDGDGIPDVAETVLGTNPNAADTDGDGIDDKVDLNPTFAENPGFTSGGNEGFKIKQAIVENNYDFEAKKDAADHLEVTVQSMSDKDIYNMNAYYTITDDVSGKNEAYIVYLKDFILKAHETQTIHFDNDPRSGHFGANPNSIYYTSKNNQTLDVTLWSDGYVPQSLQINKDAGGAETAD
jgi:hypothetical protein